MKVLLLAFCTSCALAGAGERERPLMRDFIGQNVEVAQSPMIRSYPEDPAAQWMENFRQLQKRRAERAQTREPWEAEFGFDVPPVTAEQQAIWSVRAFILLVGFGVDRAHLISAKDAGESAVHGVAQYQQPKPVFHALAWLRRSLGDYRFSHVEREDAGDCFCYEFIHSTDVKKRIWAIWKPVGDPLVVRLFHDPLFVTRAERIPLNNGNAEAVNVKLEIEGYFAVQAEERLILVWLDEK